MSLANHPRPGASRMANLAATLIHSGNASHHLNLDRIARFQGFDPAEFTALFHAYETEHSMTAAPIVEDE